jgi:hypothetical protein
MIQYVAQSASVFFCTQPFCAWTLLPSQVGILSGPKEQGSLCPLNRAQRLKPALQTAALGSALNLLHQRHASVFQSKNNGLDLGESGVAWGTSLRLQVVSPKFR